jgi:toxin secretion/phage lysis holin
VRYDPKNISISGLINWSTGIVAAVGAVFGPFIDAAYGNGRHIFFFALLLAIGMDWISGIRAAKKDDTYSSEYGLDGVYRTLFIFAFPALANQLDQIMHVSGAVFYSITLGILYHTMNSLTANAVRAGWERWIPKKVIYHVASEIQAKSERAVRKKKGRG